MSDNEEKKEKFYNRDIFWLIISGIVVILSILALILDREIWLNIISGILLALAIITFVRKGYNMYKKRNIQEEVIRERDFPTISQYSDISQGVGLEKILPEFRYNPSKSEQALLSDVDRLLANTQEEQAELDKLVNDTYALLNNMDSK